jgi:uncharacterized OB-fold protein
MGTIAISDALDVATDPPQLKAFQCSGCGARYFDKRLACSRCFGRTFDVVHLPFTGVVRSFTIVHRAAKGVRTPFISAIVELDGGTTVKANVVGCDPVPESVRPGMAVRLTTFVAGVDAAGTEAIAYAFEPA